jgi:PleD family two-component response regulator
MIFPNSSLTLPQERASKQILIVDDELFNINAIEIILDCAFNIPNLDKICQ